MNPTCLSAASFHQLNTREKNHRPVAKMLSPVGVLHKRNVMKDASGY